GTVLRLEESRVVMGFSATGEERQYAIESAPLRRVRFPVGTRVNARDGSAFVVEAIEEDEGLLTYGGSDGRRLHEADLSDILGADSPAERLLLGSVHPTRTFELRREALFHQHRRRLSSVRGYMGGRIDLIPHQL